MKRFYISLLTLFIFSFLSCSDSNRVDLETELTKVVKVLDNFNKAHEDRNLDLLMTCFSDKSDIIILGTDENELYVDKISMGKSQKRAYESFQTIKLAIRDKVLKMCPDGNQSWFYMKVNWYVESGDSQYIFDGIRTTGVLEKENDNWKIVQLHTSMPVRGQAVNY